MLQISLVAFGALIPPPTALALWSAYPGTGGPARSGAHEGLHGTSKSTTFWVFPRACSRLFPKHITRVRPPRFWPLWLDVVCLVFFGLVWSILVVDGGDLMVNGPMGGQMVGQSWSVVVSWDFFVFVWGHLGVVSTE